MNRVKNTACFLLLSALLAAGCAGPRRFSADTPEKTGPDPRAVDLFIDGVISDAEGNFASALLSYNEALLYDWKAPALNRNIGKDYLWLGREESAFLMLKRAVLLDPKDLESRGLIARLLLQKGNLAESEKEYRIILRVDSASTEAYSQLAIIALRRNEPAKAVDLYRKVIAHSRDFDSRMYWGLAELYMGQNRFQEADSVFRRLVLIDSSEATGYLGLGTVREATRDTAGAVAFYRKALDLDPELKEARERLGGLYSESGRTDLALSLSREAVSLDSTDMPSWLTIGDLQRQSGDSASAMETFRAAAVRFPDAWQPHLSLGRLLLDGGRNREAFGEFSKVAGMSEKNFLGLFLGGVALLQMDSTSESLPWFRDALEINPEEPMANFYLGNAFLQLNRSEEALPFLTRALKGRPDWVGAMSSLAGAYENLKSYALADTFYTRALRLEPDNATVLNNYGYSLTVRGIRLQEALEMTRKAVEKEPENGAFLDTMGWIYFNLGDYPQALEFIEKAYGLRKDSPDVIEHLGDVYDKLGRKDDAAAMWEKALEHRKDDPGLLKKLGRVPEPAS
jgi:tetratricopeptide (TPR) repeat protein